MEFLRFWGVISDRYIKFHEQDGSLNNASSTVLQDNVYNIDLFTKLNSEITVATTVSLDEIGRLKDKDLPQRKWFYLIIPSFTGIPPPDIASEAVRSREHYKIIMQYTHYFND